jgi:hypothetical protein
VADNTDSAGLSFTLEQLRALLAKVDAALAEGRALRERIMRTMRERRDLLHRPDDRPPRTPS